MISKRVKLNLHEIGLRKSLSYQTVKLLVDRLSTWRGIRVRNPLVNCHRQATKKFFNKTKNTRTKHNTFEECMVSLEYKTWVVELMKQ